MNFNDAVLILKENNIKTKRGIIFVTKDNFEHYNINEAINYLCDEYDWGCEIIEEEV